MELAERLDRIVRGLRQAQRRIIEAENSPDRRKRLREFPAAEVARLLGVSPSDLRRLVKQDGFPGGRTSWPGRRTFTFEDLGAARMWLAREAAPGSAERRRLDPRREADEGLQVVGFVNFKGGSGKTTSSVLFAQYLALRGYRVLLIDLDAQGSATASFGVSPSEEVSAGASFAAWALRAGVMSTGDARDLAVGLLRPTYWPGLDLVAAGASLHATEYELVRRGVSGAVPGGASARDPGAELRDFLAVVAERYDVAVCDTRPDVNMLMVNTLRAATGLVVPVQANMVDLASCAEFMGFLAAHARETAASQHGAAGRQAGASPPSPFLRVLVTRFRQGDRSQAAVLEAMEHRFGDLLLPVAMLESTMLGASALLKETPYEYEPGDGRRTYDRAIEALDAVNRAVELDVLRAWGRTGAVAPSVEDAA
jgi:chromosome partitioning protein